MAKTQSEDLRSRLIGAVEAGMSRRAPAAHLWVGVTAAIRWVCTFRETGATAAKPKGSDRRSHRIEACRDVILGAIDVQVDITLDELAELLAREHGARFASSMVWRFLDRHTMTGKKRRTPPSRIGPTSRGGAAGGVSVVGSLLRR